MMDRLSAKIVAVTHISAGEVSSSVVMVRNKIVMRSGNIDRAKRL